MAIGDQATSYGMALVPETGEEGRVRWGAREINRTRDYIAQLQSRIPTSKTGFRQSAGISSGTTDPSGGDNGDIYFKIVQ